MERRLGVPPAIELTASSLALRTPEIREEAVTLSEKGSESWLTPRSGSGVVVFRILVSRPGRHLVRLRLRGGPHLVSFGTAETRALAEVDGDSVREVPGLALKPGWMEIAVSLSPGGSLERIVIHPEAGSPIAPLGGWEPRRPLTIGAKATTLVRLGGWEEELPSAEGGPRPIPIIGGSDHQGRSVRRIRIQDEGVYTLAARMSGTPPAQILLGEGLLFPRPGIAGIRQPGGTGTLVSLGTLFLEAKDYDVSFQGAGGAIHELLHLKRIANDERYLAVARAHGFEGGRLAAAQAETPADVGAIRQNVSSVRSWLIGPLQAPAKRAESADRVPPPPKRPPAISPVQPAEYTP